jgi:hypothetical protein
MVAGEVVVERLPPVELGVAGQENRAARRRRRPVGRLVLTDVLLEATFGRGTLRPQLPAKEQDTDDGKQQRSHGADDTSMDLGVGTWELGVGTWDLGLGS